MTANQLAYASNKIEEAKAEEAARHNAAVEDETGRHNLSLEQLQEDANNISRRQTEENERHNKQMEDIQSRYNDVYLRLQEAQGNAKIAIQQELADIEQQKADEIQRHNEMNEALTSDANWISVQHEDEINRHNEAVEKLQNEMNRISELEATIHEKQQLAQSLYWSQSIEVQKLDSLRKHTIGLQQVTNQSYANMLGIYELQQRKYEWSDTSALRDSQVFGNLASSIGGIIGQTAKAIGGLYGAGVNLGKFAYSTGGF